MKFSVEDIKNLTFPSSAMGYKKKDVDDFLTYVAKDYGSYQRQLEKSQLETKAAEKETKKLLVELENQKRQDEDKFAKAIQENLALKQELSSCQTTSVFNNLDDDRTLSLAQKVALKIEKNAQEEAKTIIEKADCYYEEQVNLLEQKREELDIEMAKRLTGLDNSERIIETSIDSVKQEYRRLMALIRESYESLNKE